MNVSRKALRFANQREKVNWLRVLAKVSLKVFFSLAANDHSAASEAPTSGGMNRESFPSHPTTNSHDDEMNEEIGWEEYEIEENYEVDEDPSNSTVPSLPLRVNK